MNVVSIMAHQDDELMCLGTMLKMKNLGHNLAFICLTDGAAGMTHMPDMPFEEAAKIRAVEMKNLTSDINAEYICLNRPDEYLYDTADLRLELIEAIRFVSADVIFTHNTVDYNVDHMTACLLVRQCAMQAALPIQKTNRSTVLHFADNMCLAISFLGYGIYSEYERRGDLCTRNLAEQR